MKRVAKFGTTGLLCTVFLLSGSAVAWQRPARPTPAAQNRQNNNAHARPDRAHPGKWLKEHANLPPEQRERMINRMEKIEQLPPDKRQLLQQSMSQLAFLPQDRRQMIRKAYRNL